MVSSYFCHFENGLLERELQPFKDKGITGGGPLGTDHEAGKELRGWEDEENTRYNDSFRSHPGVGESGQRQE